MIRLGVNIDHVATVRQARRALEPDPVAAAVLALLGGADGITVHLREDRRHIQDADVRRLRQTLRTRLNLEMADVPEIVALAAKLKPDEVCLVPEKRAEVTTEGGLNVTGPSLPRTIARLQKAGILVSLFIDPDPKQVRAAAAVGANFIELHTGRYARHGKVELKKLIAAAELAHQLGLRVNAGHGLNYQNTAAIRAVPHLETLNTGHAIISRAVFVGLRQAVREMLAIMNP